jgi:hypothetical protein
LSVVGVGLAAGGWQLTANGAPAGGSIPAGQVDVVLATGAAAAGATAVTVSMPAYDPPGNSAVVPYIANPGTAPGGAFVALLHSVSGDSNPEYVRVTSSLPANTPSPGPNGTPAQYTWTFTRALQGHQNTGLIYGHAAPVALTPVAGCWTGTTQLSLSLGAGDQAMTVENANGFPLSAVSTPTTTPAFCVQIEQEIIGVLPFSDGTSPTPRAWNSPTPASAWQVLRGLYGTAAVAHRANCLVRMRYLAAYGDPIQPAPIVPSATLSSGLGANTASISISVQGSSPDLTDGFPPDPNQNPSAQFFVVIDDERLLVQDFNDASPTTWTVVRSQNGMVQSHGQGASVAVWGHRFAPLCGDFWNSSFGAGAAAGIAGFGHSTVVPQTPTATSSGSSTPAPIYLVAAATPSSAATSSPATGSAATGFVSRNASPTFLKPFAADLELSGLQSQLWQQMIGATPGSGGDVANPHNPLLAPVLVSTNVPPQPQAASP